MYENLLICILKKEKCSLQKHLKEDGVCEV